MNGVEVVTDVGLRDYGAAQAQVDIVSSRHALVTPITAALQALLPLGSFRADHGRPARIPHWFLSSLLHRGNARESLTWW